MIQRFTIEDLVAQNVSGVFFRAVDKLTDQTVGLRRFFPFGHDARGLDVQEQIAYTIGIERLAGIRHLGMRSIIYGGCDPVDQMPYIVTEWIEGYSLESYTEHGPLAQADVVQILINALEVCEVLSEIFAEEGVWIETELNSIIVGNEGSGRGATFWISPLKWLCSNHYEHGMASIIQLTEEVMHWRERIVPEQERGGLGAWLQWLRKSAETATLREVREKLFATMGMDPPPPVTKLVEKATVPIRVTKHAPKKTPSRVRLFYTSTLIVGIVAICSFLYWVKSNRAASREALQAESKVSKADQKAVRPGALFSAFDSIGLLSQEKKLVQVEGIVLRISPPRAVDVLYIDFHQNPKPGNTRGAVVIKDAGAGLDRRFLNSLVGKKVRLHGTLSIEENTGQKSPRIAITEKGSIEIIP